MTARAVAESQELRGGLPRGGESLNTWPSFPAFPGRWLGSRAAGTHRAWPCQAATPLPSTALAQRRTWPLPSLCALHTGTRHGIPRHHPAPKGCQPDGALEAQGSHSPWSWGPEAAVQRRNRAPQVTLQAASMPSPPLCSHSLASPRVAPRGSPALAGGASLVGRFGVLAFIRGLLHSLFLTVDQSLSSRGKSLLGRWAGARLWCLSSCCLRAVGNGGRVGTPHAASLARGSALLGLWEIRGGAPVTPKRKTWREEFPSPPAPRLVPKLGRRCGPGLGRREASLPACLPAPAGLLPSALRATSSQVWLTP